MLRTPILRVSCWFASSQSSATRTSEMRSSDGRPSEPLSFGSHESNLPSSCLNLNEHMKKTQRQKMMSTSGTTLIATGLSLGSWEPAMGEPPEGPGAISSRRIIAPVARAWGSAGIERARREPRRALGDPVSALLGAGLLRRGAHRELDLLDAAALDDVHDGDDLAPRDARVGIDRHRRVGLALRHPGAVRLGDRTLQLV